MYGELGVIVTVKKNNKTKTIKMTYHPSLTTTHNIHVF